MIPIRDFAQKIIDNIEKVILGKTEEVKNVLIALLSEGHLLVEDVPGVGKTMLARTIARSIGCQFSRIQFTPDLLPSDIVGVNIFNQQAREFEFKPGPVHSQVILADEINRATPKTQSALLEAMEERQVTIDRITYPLPRPFLVIATQNPIEYEGTFPLPESQLDRFFMKLRLGYPTEEAETEILSAQRIKHPIEDLEPVATMQDVIEMQKKVREVTVAENVRSYIVKLVQRTRNDEGLYLGASPRGSLSLFKAAQAEAFLKNRDFVTPDDVKAVAKLTLSHRIISRSDGFSSSANDRVIDDILQEVPIPE